MECVEYDKFVREWRCKWSPAGDKASLLQCQMALDSVFDELKEVDGILDVERLVCDECFDFKVSTYSFGFFSNASIYILLHTY